jgi:hypothetical protein
MSVFQLRGRTLLDEKYMWGLAAARPLPNPTNLSSWLHDKPVAL